MLPEGQAIAFHHSTAQLLFIAPQGRRDLQTTVAFLTTRVKEPTKDNWGKLKRALKYNKETMNLVLIIEPKSFKHLKWLIDGAHAMHPGCKGHTGIMLTLGDTKGAVLSYSQEQKLNNRISSKTKVISVDDGVPHALWTRLFLELQ